MLPSTSHNFHLSDVCPLVVLITKFMLFIQRKYATEIINLLDERLDPKSIRLCTTNASNDISWTPPSDNWNPWTGTQIERVTVLTVNLLVLKKRTIYD